jgi:Amt family ammonium transporter
VQPWAAAVIGGIAAIIIVESVFFFERKGVDDPVGAISVHGVGGIFGVLCVGIFADGRYGAGWNLTDSATTKGKGVTGILYGNGEFLGSGSFGKLGFGQLASQAIGGLVIIFVMGGFCYLFFKIQDKLMKGGIRSEEADEIAGLDLPEMGVLAYDNLQVRELDIVGVEGATVMTGGPSQDPSIGR